MATSKSDTSQLLERPKRADARRNYDKLVAAARDAFADHGTSASLEEIARRAGVGIGTLYRHFPSRQELLEAVYVEEVEEVCASVGELADLPPWEALTGWLHNVVAYVGRKHALAEELFALGKREEAQQYFQLAHNLLSKNQWLSDDQPARIQRLHRLGKPR